MNEVDSSNLESVGGRRCTMAKKEKTIHRPSRIGINLDRVENGYVVNLTAESDGKKGKYTNKRLVAPDGHAALRIATTHLQSLGSSRPKSERKKKSSRKIALRKA